MANAYRRASWLLALAVALVARESSGQTPTIDPSVPPLPGSGKSLLGEAPGAGGGSTLNNPGTAGILGSRPGPTTPHGIPISLSNPNSGFKPTQDQQSPNAPTPEPIGPASIPAFGSLDLPAGEEDLGPKTGMTLDAAIDRLLRDSPDLKAKFLEIPMARADVLQASLRANPIFYQDAQLMPYGQYSKLNLGGPPQYDTNVSIPLDVTRKRKARTLVAERALSVMEASYQDAVRLKIDDLYTVYLQVLDDRQTVRYTTQSYKRLSELADRTKKLFESKTINRSDYNSVILQQRTARIALRDAEAAYLKSRQGLAAILNLPKGSAGGLELRGSVFDPAPPPPPVDVLIRQALNDRPDLIAYRLGLKRAAADIVLAKANRMSDVYVLAQPYTFQNNQPFGLKSATAWALGVTVPLPLFNRNQGSIVRARVNLDQTRFQLANIQRQIIAQVETAYTEYEVTRREVEDIAKEVLTLALENREVARRLYLVGETSVITYINTELSYSTAVKQYLDTAVRHRRSMLDLNTAVGRRIMP